MKKITFLDKDQLRIYTLLKLFNMDKIKQTFVKVHKKYLPKFKICITILLDI